MHTYGTIHVDPSTLAPYIQCEHDDGDITVRLAPLDVGIDVVLTGSTAEIMAFADKFSMIVNQRLWDEREAARSADPNYVPAWPGGAS